MAWLKKKIDPISHRAAALSAEIAALESQIKKLGTRLEEKQSHPRLRSTALPHGPTVQRTAMPAIQSPTPPAHEPIFEEVDHDRLKAARGDVATPEHFNDLGVRK